MTTGRPADPELQGVIMTIRPRSLRSRSPWRLTTSSPARGLALLAAAGILSACGAGTTPAAGSTDPTLSATVSGLNRPAAPATESNPAGDIPDTQVFVDYAGGGYTVQVPEGWARIDSGSTTSFTDKYNNISIDTAARPTAPTVQTGRAELTLIRSTATGFVPGDVSSVQRPAGSAVLITYQADSAPNEVTGKVVSDAVERYEFFSGGTEVVLTLSGPVGSDNVDPWRTVTDSFRWAA
jgi:hypothetical protein